MAEGELLEVRFVLTMLPLKGAVDVAEGDN